MSFWRKYRGRNVGRLIHYLYYYCGLNVAEHAEFSGNEIKYHGKLLATYEWSDSFGMKDVPVFEFKGTEAHYYAKQQQERGKEAFIEGFSYNEPSERLEVDFRILIAMEKRGYQSANLWASISEKECKFFIGEKNLLYVSIGEELYYWDHGVDGWLQDT